MKAIGIILIIAGILMFIFPGINCTTNEKVINVGSVSITKKENNTISWPFYAGGIAIVAGIIILIVDRNKK